MEVSGKVKAVNDEQQVSASFKKRNLIVTSDEQYPQHIEIEFTQDKCDLLNSLKVGQNITVGINLRGREWVNPQGETKYFNSIQGWRIEKGNNEPIDGGSDYNSFKENKDYAVDNPTNAKGEIIDDLPF